MQRDDSEDLTRELHKTLHALLKTQYRILSDGGHFTLSHEDYDKIQRLVDQGADLNRLFLRTEVEPDGGRNLDSALHFAVMLGDARLLQLFLTRAPKMIDVLQENQDYYGRQTRETPLTLAIYHREYELAKQLLEAGANPNALSYTNAGVTSLGPLQLAAAYLSDDDDNKKLQSLVSVIKLLLVKGSDIDLLVMDGWDRPHPTAREFLQRCLKEYPDRAELVEEIIEFSETLKQNNRPETQLARQELQTKLAENRQRRHGQPVAAASAPEPDASAADKQAVQARLSETKARRVMQRQLAENKERRQQQFRMFPHPAQSSQSIAVETLAAEIQRHIETLENKKNKITYRERRHDKIELLKIAKRFLLNDEVTEAQFEEAKSTYPKWNLGDQSVTADLVRRLMEIKLAANENPESTHGVRLIRPAD